MHSVHSKSRNSARCRTSTPVSLDPPPSPRVQTLSRDVLGPTLRGLSRPFAAYGFKFRLYPDHVMPSLRSAPQCGL